MDTDDLMLCLPITQATVIYSHKPTMIALLQYTFIEGIPSKENIYWSNSVIGGFHR